MFNVVLIVGVMVVIMNLLVSREFQGYIRANDLERFQNVKEGLQQLDEQFHNQLHASVVCLLLNPPRQGCPR